jgi:hypothetical protein
MRCRRDGRHNVLPFLTILTMDYILIPVRPTSALVAYVPIGRRGPPRRFVDTLGGATAPSLTQCADGTVAVFSVSV